MAEKYTGEDRRYSGEEVDVTYNVKRCIHAKQCVNRLAEVFDTQKRPWINVASTPADRVAGVVELCPSGALHHVRKDGIQEAIPQQNVIIAWQNGPLEIRGDLALSGATVELQQETRVTLCRCGASKNKPFCDNSHNDIAFQTPELAPAAEAADPLPGGKLTIIAHENAALEFQGAFTIMNEAHEILASGENRRLCRCGGSSNKPFCDGTHKRIAFIAE